MRKVKVLYKDVECGILEESTTGFTFSYFETYIKQVDAEPISLRMAISNKPFISTQLFPLFRSKLAEGVNRANICREYSIDFNDDMGLICLIAKNNTQKYRDTISYALVE